MSMREMKDSGIEWIGLIPEDWEVRKIKNLVTQKNSLLIDGDWIESKVIESNGIPYFTTGNIGDGIFKDASYNYISENTFNKLGCIEAKGGDILFSRLNLPIGRACIIPKIYNRCVVAVDNVIFRPDKTNDKKYLVYVTMCRGYQDENTLIARGTTMQRISRTLLENVQLPIPSYLEQCRIATFLDEKCKDIDTLITFQEEMIAELQAYKQSVISEAVTKGLNPNVTMKDSGVEWIGEIPTHWNTAHLNYFVSKVGSGSTPRGGSNIYVQEGIKFLRSQNVYFEGLILNDVAYITPEIHDEMQNTKVMPKDVLLNITGGSIGRCYYVDEKLGEANVNQHVCIIRPTKLNSIYLKYFLQSNLGQTQIDRLQTGSNREGLSAAALKKFIIFEITLTEQQAIADYLDTKCSQIDELIALKQQKITELQDYKKSLIYEYVTGKKEVPANN